MEQELLRIATLQIITTSTQFTHTNSSAIQTLTQILSNYIYLLATTAKENAESAGRGNVAIWDLGRAIDEFGVGRIADLKDEMEAGGREDVLGLASVIKRE